MFFLSACQMNRTWHKMETRRENRFSYSIFHEWNSLSNVFFITCDPGLENKFRNSRRNYHYLWASPPGSDNMARQTGNLDDGEISRKATNVVIRGKGKMIDARTTQREELRCRCRETMSGNANRNLNTLHVEPWLCRYWSILLGFLVLLAISDFLKYLRWKFFSYLIQLMFIILKILVWKERNYNRFLNKNC